MGSGRSQRRERATEGSVKFILIIALSTPVIVRPSAFSNVERGSRLKRVDSEKVDFCKFYW